MVRWGFLAAACSILAFNTACAPTYTAAEDVPGPQCGTVVPTDCQRAGSGPDGEVDDSPCPEVSVHCLLGDKCVNADERLCEVVASDTQKPDSGNA